MKDFKEAIAKQRKIALYARMDSDWYTVWEVDYTNLDEHYHSLPEGELREKTRENYVRITEPIEVEFRAISSDEIVQKAVEALNEEERAIIRDLNQKLADIRSRKNQLLALTHQVEAA